MLDEDKIYDDFMNKYENYPKELFSLVSALRPLLPPNTEDKNYNLGTMKKDDDLGLSPNIAVINAHSFEKSFNDYKQNNPEMSETEIKARVVFDFLKQHMVPFSYEKNKDDFLFNDGNGNSVNREQFYAYAIYNNALTNTNFFDRNIGNVQIMCLEPKSVTDTPRNITGLLQKNIDKFMNIPTEERLEILYKRGLYHESVHMVMGTSDERKCDAFALLKTMEEHPKYAKTVFDIYNIQRSKMGYTVGTLKGKNEIARQKAIKCGAMTYLMPNTYKKLEQYALNPQLIPKNDAEILKLTYQLTSEPEFSKEQLASFMELMQKDNISTQDLGENLIVQSCMKQGGFNNINEYINSDRKLTEIVQDFEIKQRIADLKKRLPYQPPVSKSKTIDELRGIQSNKASKPVKQTTLDVAAVKQKTIQNEG